MITIPNTTWRWIFSVFGTILMVPSELQVDGHLDIYVVLGVHVVSCNPALLELSSANCPFTSQHRGSPIECNVWERWPRRYSEEFQRGSWGVALFISVYSPPFLFTFVPLCSYMFILFIHHLSDTAQARHTDGQYRSFLHPLPILKIKPT